MPPRAFRRLFRFPWRSRERIRAEIDEEIGFHLEMRREELMATHGMDPDYARERALREFGDVLEAKRALRRDDERIERRASWRNALDELRIDVSYAARTLRKRPGFAIAAVMTLSLGIGANTAVYGVARAVLLRPLPYAQPDQLVSISERHVERSVEKNVVSSGNYMDWRDRNRSFEDLGAYSGAFGLALTGGKAPEHVIARTVSPSIFSILGVRPEAGRAFHPTDDPAAGPDDIIISYGLWQRRFGGSPTAIGQTLRINEEPHRVLGVMPHDFRFPTAETDVWIRRTYSEDDRQTRNAHQWYVLGRLRDGATVEQAREEMQAIAAGIAEEHPEFMAGWGVSVQPYRRDLVGEARPALLALLAGAGLLLLIACANVANLLLARGVARRTETAVRAALGAGRGRLTRQFLVESGLLAFLGGAGGVLIAVALTRFLVSVGPPDLPLLDQTRVDSVVLGFAGGIVLLTVVLVGLLPAVRQADGRLAAALAGARAVAGNAGDRRTRSALLVGQVAVSVVLLVGAGLLVRSFIALNRVDYGFDADGLAAASFDLGSSRYAPSEAQIAFVNELRARVAALPGVQGVAGTSDPPVVGYQFQFDFGGRPPAARPGSDGGSGLSPGRYARFLPRDANHAAAWPRHPGRRPDGCARRGSDQPRTRKARVPEW